MHIKDKILTIRGKQVLLDRDLAELYEVETRRLNEQVKRNIERFPEEFMFQLNENEFNNLWCQIGTTNNDSLRSQNVTLNREEKSHPMILKNKEILRSQNATSSLEHGGIRYFPYAFTEQGVAMLSGVLRSQIAVKTSIQIMNAFVSMRRFLSENADVFKRLDKVEIKLLDHDNKFNKIFNAIESKQIKPKQGIFYDGQIFDVIEIINF